MSSSNPKALIVVADKDLAKALATGLQACGLACEVHPSSAVKSAQALRDWQALLIDVALLPVKPQRYVASLRAQGWLGLTVLLAEDNAFHQTAFEPADNVAILIKPFGKPQLLEIAARLGRSPS